MRQALAAALLALALQGAGAVGPVPPMIDAHAHYTAEDAQVLPPAALLARLDAAGVTRVFVSGTPPHLALTLHRQAPERVVPLLGVYTHALGKALWMHDTTLPARVQAQLDTGPWAGIGELHLFARDAASPVFEALVRLAEARGLLLLIHGDTEVLDRAFAIAPGLRVLWAHLGTVPLPEVVEATLERHAGRAMWVDTSVRDERIAPHGVLLPEWRELFERHPTRIVVAVDAFSTQRWQRYGDVVHTIRTWLDGLPPGLAQRLRHDNAAAMLAAGPVQAPGAGASTAR